MAWYLGHYKWKTRARAFELCGQAGIHLSCRGCGDGTVVPFRCACRTCIHAQRTAGAKVLGRMEPRIDLFNRLMEVEPWDGNGRQRRRSWRMVTLTSPASRVPDANWELATLRRAVVAVNKAASRWWRLTPWGRQVVDATSGRKRSRRDTAALVALEIGKWGMVHAHVLLYGEYWSHDEIQEAWSRAMGCDALVDVRQVSDPESGLREVVKYVSKGVGKKRLAPRRAAHAEIAMRNVHRTRVLGRLRRVKVLEDDANELGLTLPEAAEVEKVCCEGCGEIGAFKWVGVVSARYVQESGGFGYVGTRSYLPQFDEMDEWMAQRPRPLGTKCAHERRTDEDQIPSRAHDR